MMEEVPGITFEDMEREAALARLGQYKMPELAEHEFITADVKAKYNMSETSIRRWLSELEDEGVLESGKRYDPGSERIVKAYWFKKPSG